MNNPMVGPVVEAVVDQTRRRHHHVNPRVKDNGHFVEAPANQIKAGSLEPKFVQSNKNV